MRKKLALIASLVAIVIIIAYRTTSLKDTLPASPASQSSTKASSNINELGLKIPDGFSIAIFAKEQDNARDLEFSPEGILLASLPAQGKIVALPDNDRNGKADQAKNILTGLDRPHGIAFFDGKLFVAEETKIARYNWDSRNLSASLDKFLFELPKGGRHVTRTIAFNKNGQMFVSIGSTCDVCFEDSPWLASVIISDYEGNNPRLFAKGLRNSVFITVNPTTGELWGTEMGRDFLGDNLPPDEVNIIREGDYGWPLCYGNQVHDTDFDKKVYIQVIPQPPCGETEPPVFEIAAHSAPLGLTFVNSPQFPQDWQGDLLVAYHGSWNRSTPIGYKVVRLNVSGNSVTQEEDFLSGFLPVGATGPASATGRPVDLVFDQDGNLYISDDKAGVIYVLQSKRQGSYRIWR